MRPHLLIVQDNGSETAATLDSLRDWMDGAFTVEAVRRCDNAVARLVTPDPGRRAAIGPVVAILADLALPDSSGAQTFQRLHAAAPQVPIVLLCAPANEAVARAMMSHGAQDYLVKTRIDSYALPKALTGAIERAHVADAAAARGAAANATLQAIGDAVVATDVEGRVIYLNSAAEQLTGWTRAAATGQPVDHVFRIVDAETRRPARSPLEHAIRSDSIGRLASDCVLIRRDGSEAAVEDSAAPIHDRNGRVTGGVMVFHDVSAARSRSRYLAHLAQHDRLTGLCNRGLMRDRLTQAMSLAGRHEHGVAVLFLDVDGFKGVNDTLGHAVGDRLLQSVAQQSVHPVD